MNKFLLLPVFFLFSICYLAAQTKVSGYVVDDQRRTCCFCFNVILKILLTGTITNENGRFYLESDETWDTLTISFIGYETVQLELYKKVNYDLKLVLNEDY